MLPFLGFGCVLADLWPQDTDHSMTHDFAKNAPIDRDKLRDRLQGMSNKELREFGKACELGCSEKGASGEPPPKDFMIQLELAREEWKRRMKRRGTT